MKSKNAVQSSVCLEEEVKKGILDWVSSLSAREASAKSIIIGGVEYSPLQIQKEVEQETMFGKYFIAGLCTLNEQMVTADPKASVIALIRNSLNHVGS